MAIYTFDTHATIKELEAAGMESRQAEAVVAALRTASQSKISCAAAELVTKRDLAILKAEIWWIGISVGGAVLVLNRVLDWVTG